MARKIAAPKHIYPQLPGGFSVAPNTVSLGDADAVRNQIFETVLDAAHRMPPVENEKYRLVVENPHFADPIDPPDPEQHYEALMNRKTLAARLRGDWVLYDKATNKPIARRRVTIARIPIMSRLGSFVINGRNYSVINQSRLRPGVYVLAGKAQRVQVNVPPGYGFSYNVEINPKTNKVFVRVGNMKLPFYNFMKTIGAKDEEIKQALGEDIYKANVATAADNKSVESFVKAIAPKTFQFTGNPHEDLRRLVLSTPVDKNVVWRTTGVKGQSLNPQMILSATKRLLGVLRGEDSGDKRDNLLFQKVYTPADLLAERFLLDSGGVRRNLFKKVVVDGNLEKIRPFALDDYIQQLFFQSGLGQYMEEINPIEIADYRFRVTRMGQGGIPSEDAIPEETRNVHDTHLGFLDPVRTPESGRAGVDLYFASMVRRGKDGELYIPLRNLQRGRVEYVKLADIYDTPIRIPGQPGVHDAVLAAGRIRDRLPSEKPLYELPEFDMAFTVTNNLIPFKMNMKGQRASMSSRMFIQSLPLRNREAPLVRNATPFDKTLSYDEYYGPLVGNLYAPCSGVVKRVDKRRVVVQCDNGKEHRLPLYRILPFNRKTSFYHTPLVKAGDRVVGNQLLAKSNYSDDSGAVALGTNARVAYVPYEGLNFEDAVVVSESFAKKLTSEHMYKEEVEINPEIRLGKKSYLSVFPGKFKREQLEKLDDDGVVKPGTIVYKDDPLILATKLNPVDRTKVHLKGRRSVSSAALTWDHDDPGEVVDVVRTRKGVSVVVKAYRPAQVGDKIVGRYADKGVIAAIIPDSEMIRDEKGRPFDVLMNPMGIPSRGNTGQLLEALLGKVAAKKGEPIVVPDFENYGDAYNWALKIAKENHVKEKEDLIDPKTGRRIKGKVTGVRYILKLQHQSEDKLQGRFTGSYTLSETPGKGGDDGAKRLGLLQTNGLISHGATQFLRDAHLIRGNKNEEFWLRYMMGQDPPVPDVPVVYEKFLAYLHGMGVSLKQREGKFRIMEMTDKDVEKLAGNRKLQNARTVEWGEELKPIPGGLFDPKLTGGHNGRGWTYIELPEPMPNPVMETPMAWLLGIPIADVEKVLACEKELPNGGCGPEAIKQELSKINLDQWIEKYKRLAQTSSKSQLDKVYKILSVLTAAKRKGVHPKEWMITKVPVVPPAYRPVAMLQGSGTPIVNDLNWLYKQLFDVSENLREIKKEGLDVNEDRIAVYRAMKELAGFAEPKSRMLKGMNIKGILRHVVGSTAKEGMVQRELLSTNVDVVGRGVVTPDPRLGMDEIGIPEDTAWEIYRPFVVREMTQSGIPLRQALYDVKEKTDRAKRYLLKVMQHRPVVVSRDPVLHKFGIMGMWPRLTKDKTIHVSPLVVSGYGMDFDGDSCSGDTIVTIDMPSDDCYNTGDIDSFASSEGDMFDGNTAVATRTQTRVCKRVRLDEFPRIEESVVTKPSGVQVYKVPPGVRVLSYDAVTGETGFFEVTEFSVHPNCQGYQVTTARKRVIEVSEDHSLYVFDRRSGEVVRCRPEEAVGRLVPVVRRIRRREVWDRLEFDRSEFHKSVRTKYWIVDSIDLDFDFGHWVGVMVGDGWTNWNRRSMTCYAEQHQELIDHFDMVVHRLFPGLKRMVTRYSRHVDEGMGLDDVSVCSIYNGAGLSRLVHKWFYADGNHGAANKKLPDWFVFAPEECLWGILSGLLDSDGTVSVNKNGKLICGITTVSETLVDQLGLLCRLLGLRYHVSTTKRPGRQVSYFLAFSNVDVYRNRHRIRLIHPKRRKIMESLREFVVDKRDIIPVKYSIARWMASVLPTGGTDYTAMIEASHKGYSGRAVFRRAFEKIESLGVDIPAEVRVWRERFVENEDVIWDVVRKVEKTEVQTMYDITVPETKVFAANDGVVVFDSTNFHVPVSEQARKEVIERMMPSSNLFSTRDYKKVLHRPSREYLLGIYRASQLPSQKQPVRVKNENEAIRLWLSGQLDANDPVEIG